MQFLRGIAISRSLTWLLDPPDRLILRNFTAFLLSFFWIASCCIAEVSHGGDFGDAYGGLGNKTREFDFFKLSLLWPGTDCRTTRHCCPSNACCLRSNALTEFTIHGLWPDYNDGTWPACCSGKRFDVKEISMLLSDLNKYWPSLSCDSPTNCRGGKGLFWEHEWEKHGTCSSPVVQDEYGYFVTTLNLYFQYNVTEVLREAGFVASNSENYPVGGIVAAIQNAFHATPELECSGDAVEELRLCFHKDFKIRDCAVESNTEKSCPRYVRFPDVSSSEFFLQLDTS